MAEQVSDHIDAAPGIGGAAPEGVPQPMRRDSRGQARPAGGGGKQIADRPRAHGRADDPLECVWSPPSPLLLQHRTGTEDRPFSRHYIKRRLADVAMAAGLTAIAGGPLAFTPHDMRRIFTTEALQNGLPPHICQLILGHKNLNTTMGYNNPRELHQAGEKLQVAC